MAPVSPASRRIGVAALAVGVVLGAVALTTRTSTVSVLGVTVRTRLLVATVAGLLYLPSVVSHLRAGDARRGARDALFGAGFPLVFYPREGVAVLGLVVVLAGVAVSRLAADGDAADESPPDEPPVDR
jgi:hypothetical protein